MCECQVGPARIEDATAKRSWLDALEGRVASIVLFAILTSSLALNVALGWKVQGPAARVASKGLRQRPGIQEKAVLPESIPAVDATGQRTTLKLRDDRPTVLYVLAPGCGWCKKNNANVRAMAAARSSEYRFIGLATRGEGLQEYLTDASLGFPVFVVGKESLVAELSLQVTPQTLLVTPQGVVQKTWLGAFHAADRREVESLFRLTLPPPVETADGRRPTRRG